jgi:hypothetical protein
MSRFQQRLVCAGLLAFVLLATVWGVAVNPTPNTAAIPPGGCTPVPKCVIATPTPTAIPTPTVTPVPTATPTPAPPTPTPPPSGNYLIATRAEILALSTSNSSYVAMKALADSTWAAPSLTNGESVTAALSVSAGLVYARTGITSYKTKVENVLAQLPGQDISTADLLDMVRQLGGYVIAADLVGYRPSTFVNWVASMRTHTFCCHSRWTQIEPTSEDSASNWGTWAMATRLATSLYLGDSVDIPDAVTVFKGYLGDRSSYSGFAPTLAYDPTWDCDPALSLVGINRDCGDRNGAIIEDISRSAGSYPSWDEDGRMYSWEAMSGVVISARLLEHNGYPTVWTWSSNALLRAATFLDLHGGYPPPFSVTQYIPWEINDAYGSSFGPLNPAGRGRSFCCTDWLNGR